MGVSDCAEYGVGGGGGIGLGEAQAAPGCELDRGASGCGGLRGRNEWEMPTAFIETFGAVERSPFSLDLEDLSYADTAEITGPAENHVGVRTNMLKGRFMATYIKGPSREPGMEIDRLKAAWHQQPLEGSASRSLEETVREIRHRAAQFNSRVTGRDLLDTVGCLAIIGVVGPYFWRAPQMLEMVGAAIVMAGAIWIIVRLTVTRETPPALRRGADACLRHSRP